MKNMKDTAVILVDMQDFFLHHLQDGTRRKLIANQLEIIDLCMKNKVPIIVTEYKCRGISRGKMVPILQDKVKASLVKTIVKLNNGGFTKTELDSVLKSLKIKKLIVMGVNGNGCVQDTVIGALNRGYEVLISQGTIASAGQKDLESSKRNKLWYEEHTIFFDGPERLLRYLSK